MSAKKKNSPPKLPPFGEEQRNLFCLATRADLNFGTACFIVSTPPSVVSAWLEHDSDEAADFQDTYEKAIEDAARTKVVVANTVREHVREDPAAAAKYLKEVVAERELERIKELTAAT